LTCFGNFSALEEGSERSLILDKNYFGKQCYESDHYAVTVHVKLLEGNRDTESDECEKEDKEHKKILEKCTICREKIPSPKIVQIF